MFVFVVNFDMLWLSHVEFFKPTNTISPALYLLHGCSATVENMKMHNLNPTGEFDFTTQGTSILVSISAQNPRQLIVLNVALRQFLR